MVTRVSLQFVNVAFRDLARRGDTGCDLAFPDLARCGDTGLSVICDCGISRLSQTW